MFNNLEELFITKWESKKMPRTDSFIAYYKSQWKGKSDRARFFQKQHRKLTTVLNRIINIIKNVS